MDRLKLGTGLMAAMVITALGVGSAVTQAAGPFTAAQATAGHAAYLESCASCHNKMDPLGFGLENYDGIGRWRTMDGKFPVDSSGTLPNGKTFSSPAEMRTLFQSQLPAFSRCVTEKMLTYSLGRGLGAADRRVVDDIERKVAAGGYGFQTLIFEIVRSLPFQSRRGENGPKG